MTRKARVQVGVTLTPEMAARAETLALAQNISVQELLRRLLVAYPKSYFDAHDDATQRRAQATVPKVRA